MTDVYHFTHIENLATIIKDGGLMSDSECVKQGKVPARSGNAQIKQRRFKQPIDAGVGMGGVVADYVPFYYAPRSPMLYSIQRGNVPGVAADQDPIVYCVARAQDFSPPQFVVTDGNAASGFTCQYGTHADISSKVDWKVMNMTSWKNTDQDGDRMRRRMAEFLVHRFVEWHYVKSLVTRVPATQQAVLHLYVQLKPAHQPPVTVNANWYY